jgi:hypothetical protein
MLAGGLLLIAVVASSADDDTVARALQAGFLAAAVASAVIGLAQYFGVSSQFTPWMNVAEAGEAYGNLRQPNLFATLCWIGGAVLLFGSVRVPFVLRLVAAALLAAGCAASVSRTGLLEGVALTLLAAVWGGQQRRQRLVLCAVAALAYVLATWCLPALLEAASGQLPARTLWARIGGGAACSGRTVLWANVLHLIGQKPLTGWGWGELDYAHYLTLYDGPRFCDILDNAHNLPLHLAVELGLPLALLCTGGALAWAWRRQPWREQDARRQLGWALLVLVALHSMLEYPLWYGPFQIAFGAAVAWVAPRSERRRPATLHAPSAIAVALLALATAYAAWDYARVSQIYLVPEQRRAAWRDDTLSHVRRSWLFSGQAEFADLTLQEVTPGNVQRVHALAERSLHYSPEPRVIERLIESETLLGGSDAAVLDLARFRAAFPHDYETWRASVHMPLPRAP